MESPYLPINLEEFPRVVESDLIAWPSGKIRVIGRLMHKEPEDDPSKIRFLTLKQLETRLAKPPRSIRSSFLPSDEICLFSTDGEHKIKLDFR